MTKKKSNTIYLFFRSVATWWWMNVCDVRSCGWSTACIHAPHFSRVPNVFHKPLPLMGGVFHLFPKPSSTINHNLPPMIPFSFTNWSGSAVTSKPIPFTIPWRLSDLRYHTYSRSHRNACPSPFLINITYYFKMLTTLTGLAMITIDNRLFIFDNKYMLGLSIEYASATFR